MHSAHDGSLTKFSYRSRNKVLALLWRGAYSMKTLGEHGFVKNQDDVWQLEQAPIHYFVYTVDVSCLQPRIIWPGDKKMYRVEKPDAKLLRPAVNLADDNTIISYYDSVEDELFGKFATEVLSKGAERCNQDFFVVNNKDLCYVVSTQDPQISYSFAAKDRYKYLPKIMNGSMTVKALATSGIEVEEGAGEFQICNYDGQILTENHLFILQVLNDEEERGIFYDVDNKGYGDVAYFSHPYNWFTIVEYENGPENLIGFANPHNPEYFKIKSVDGIIYLISLDDSYMGMGIGSDDPEPAIYTYKDTPPKDKRLRINISEGGRHITFGMWYEKDKLALV